MESYVFVPYIIRNRVQSNYQKGERQIEGAGCHERLRLSLFAGASSLLHHNVTI